MANRESYPSALFPIQGDASAEAGDTTVTVTGIQTTPVDDATPLPGQLLVMNSDGTWHPEDPVVSGTDEVGTVPTKPPVQVAGVDETYRVRELRTDTYGSLRSLPVEDLLRVLIGEVRALKLAVVNLDNTALVADFAGEDFIDCDPSN